MRKLKKLILALLLAGGRVAAAQTANGSPDDTEAQVHQGEKPEAKDGKEAEDADPSRHFNFANFGYSGKDEYGGKFGDGEEVTPDGAKVEEEPMSPPFVFLLLNFGLLLWIFAKYLAPAGRKVAEERHDQIKSALDEAAKLRDQAKTKLAE